MSGESTTFNSCNTSDFPFIADGDLSDKQFHAVKASTSVVKGAAIAGANERILGILQNAPKSGELATVATVRGRSSKCIAGTGGIAKGDELMVESGGALIKASGSAQKVVGVCIGAAAAGEQGECVLIDAYVA